MEATSYEVPISRQATEQFKRLIETSCRCRENLNDRGGVVPKLVNA